MNDHEDVTSGLSGRGTGATASATLASERDWTLAFPDFARAGTRHSKALDNDHSSGARDGGGESFVLLGSGLSRKNSTSNAIADAPRSTRRSTSSP